MKKMKQIWKKNEINLNEPFKCSELVTGEFQISNYEQWPKEKNLRVKTEFEIYKTMLSFQTQLTTSTVE